MSDNKLSVLEKQHEDRQWAKAELRRRLIFREPEICPTCKAICKNWVILGSKVFCSEDCAGLGDLKRKAKAA